MDARSSMDVRALAEREGGGEGREKESAEKAKRKRGEKTPLRAGLSRAIITRRVGT